VVQQVKFSLRRIWPRAQSKLYEEPKKLVALGYAEDQEEWVGRRCRTRYTITESGREALRAWLAEPGEGPSLEFEQLLKIDFADSGGKQNILTNLAATLDWVQRENAENLVAGRAYLAGKGNFPERAALNLIGGRFLTDSMRWSPNGHFGRPRSWRPGPTTRAARLLIWLSSGPRCR
jgi:PadR family transcriptional regulator, regulatory protein AphA